MTDGNTHAIDQHLDEREDWDALQEVTAALEQAEARIEEIEEQRNFTQGLVLKLDAKLAKAVKVLDEAVYLLAPNEKDMVRQASVYRIVTTIAELKGEQ